MKKFLKILSEKWRDVEGYNGLYQVSNLGKVRSYTKRSKGNNLKLRINHDGYLCTELSKDKKRKGFRVSRLVAQAFIPNPNNKPEVNHKDSNRANNHIDNLEWSTHGENIRHAYKNGAKSHSGEKHPCAKLNEKQVRVMRYLKCINPKMKLRTFARIFRVSSQVVYAVLNNKSWKHITINL